MNKIKDFFTKQHKYTFIDMIFISLSWILCGMAVFFALITTIPEISTFILGPEKEPTFFFEDNKEVTRIYYDGYISIKVTDNSIEVTFEDLRKGVIK